MNTVAQIVGFATCLFVGGLCLTILVWIWQGKIDLSSLLSESNGQASISRFQLLIFTFVIAMSLFELVEMRVNPNGFPEIPVSVLILLGISASIYLIGKGISYSQPELMRGGSAEGDIDGSDVDSAVAAAQAAANQAAAHAAAAQAAVQETASSAARAQQAADQAGGTSA